MSTQQELLKWLHRTEKSFLENLQFAIKAWRSFEFTLSSKYDIIINWVAEEGAKQNGNDVPTKEFAEILELRAQPALITLQSKRKFVEMLLEHASSTKSLRVYPELLYKLLALEWMQDLIRSDFILTTRIYGRLFHSYETYLKENESNQLQLTAHESNFFTQILNLLKEQLKNSGDLEDWLSAYDSHIVQPLTEVLLLLRTKYGIDFFDELRELERTLRGNHKSIVKYLLELPIHSAMLTLECSIANRRMDQGLLLEMFKQIFPLSESKDLNITKSLLILRATYVLDILRKHNVLLNFEVNNQSAMSYLGASIHEYARLYKDSHLCEVLLLLCATLRLNPLILEQYIFELTSWMIVAPKSIEDDGQMLALFEDYLSLLLDTFRRLSRAEKFVVNLLKALKKWLDEHQIQSITLSPKKILKRKLKQLDTTTNKQIKMENGVSVPLNISTDSFVEMLFYDLKKQLKSMKLPQSHSASKGSFIYLTFSWPSETIGCTFSRLITSLVTKAGLTIWKTLIYALKDQLTLLSSEPTTTENSYFRLDFHAALFCQCLAGIKPTEQYEKHVNEISQLRELTKQTLTTFGEFVLVHPYHKRIMNSFLECCYYTANLELLLAYYKPDGLEDKTLTETHIIPNLHAFLSPDQWSIIQERIKGHGKSDCRTLLDRLELQRIEARKLLQENFIREKRLFCSTDSCEELLQIMSGSTNGSWIISQLSRSEKIKLIKSKMMKSSSLDTHNFLENISENAEALELLGYTIFEHLIQNFFTNSKSSLLSSLNCDFESIRQCSILDHQEFDKIIKTTVSNVVENFLNIKVKSLPEESVKKTLELLPRLPLGHLRRQAKSLLFVFYIAFYQDLRAAEADLEAKQLFDSLTDLLHFGHQVPIFRYFEMTTILKLLPPTECWDFYKYLFATIKNEEKGTDEFLKSLEQLLSKTLKTTGTLGSDERRLLLLAIETLNSLSGLIGRRMHKHLHELLVVYGDYVYTHFENETSTKKDKKFVEKTLAGFAPFAKAVFVATASNKNTEKENEKTKENSQKTVKPLDENFRRICKIYIGHSMNYREPHAVQLTQVALKNRKLLHLDLDEIELVLNTYWRQLNIDIKERKEPQEEDIVSEENPLTSNVGIGKTAETLVKMIIENKTNEDFLLTLKDIGSNMMNDESYVNTIDLVILIAKSSFSTIKGAIFNEQFKQLMGSIILRLTTKDPEVHTEDSLVLKLLSCQQACVENRTVPITPDTLDTILGFLININLKKFSITDTNTISFFKLHSAMTALCSSLIKHRHILLMDRVSQFLHIFKDLLEAIVLYKSDRQKDTALNPDELNELAELALKLEVLMHTIATQKTDVKRVAPFVLIFTINLMVSGKRPTTLYPKIKTHIEAICYSLIGICDHRAGHFILRCSNEAARQTYELLVKDHKKYHKFKGKV